MDSQTLERSKSPFRLALDDLASAKSRGSTLIEPACGTCFKKIMEEAEKTILGLENERIRDTLERDVDMFMHKEDDSDDILHKYSTEARTRKEGSFKSDNNNNISIRRKGTNALKDEEKVGNDISDSGVTEDDGGEDEMSFGIRSKKTTKDKIEVLTKTQYKDALERERLSGGGGRAKKASSTTTTIYRPSRNLVPNDTLERRPKTPNKVSSSATSQYDDTTSEFDFPLLGGDAGILGGSNRKKGSRAKDQQTSGYNNRHSWLGGAVQGNGPPFENNKSHNAYNRDQMTPQRESQMVAKIVNMEESTKELEFTIKQRDEVVLKVERKLHQTEDRIRELELQLDKSKWEVEKCNSTIDGLRTSLEEKNKEVEIKYQELAVETIKSNKGLEEAKCQNKLIVSRYEKELEILNNKLQILTQKEEDEKINNRKELISKDNYTYGMKPSMSICNVCGIPYNDDISQPSREVLTRTEIQNLYDIINILKHYLYQYGESNFQLWFRLQLTESDINRLYQKIYYLITNKY